MLSLSVGDQVGDERLCYHVPFGPDAEGPAEISARDRGQEIRSAAAITM